jgi:hypothetical protein
MASLQPSHELLLHAVGLPCFGKTLAVIETAGDVSLIDMGIQTPEDSVLTSHSFPVSICHGRHDEFI